MNELIRFEDKKALKSFSSTFNARRPDKLLKFNAELAHFESQIAAGRDDDPKKDLTKCTQESYQMCMLESANLGLSWNKSLGYCYAIKYGDTCTLTIGYRGLVHLCMKSGVLKSIQGEVVCQNDPVFDQWDDEKGAHFKHVKARENRGKITHSYCLAKFTNGDHHLEVIEAADLEKIKNAAKTKMIWNIWLIPMSIKAAIRRGWKFWPKDDGGRIEMAMDAMDKTEPMDFGNLAPVDEEPQYITVNEDQRLELHALVHDAYSAKDDSNPTKKADDWMKLLCQAMGIRELKQLPADRFDEAVNRIQERLNKIAEKETT